MCFCVRENETGHLIVVIVFSDLMPLVTAVRRCILLPIVLHLLLCALPKIVRRCRSKRSISRYVLSTELLPHVKCFAVAMGSFFPCNLKGLS